MATIQDCSGLLSLPPEVLLRIFGFISAPTDRVNVCLVSKQSNSAMLPILYNTLRLFMDKETEARQQIAPLLNSRNPGLQHVRHLHFHTVDPSASMSELTLLFIVNMLPRDCLRSLSSNIGIKEPEELLDLLGQHQKQLELLGLERSPLDAFLGVHAGRMRHLPRLRSLNATGYDELDATDENDFYRTYSTSFEQLCSIRLNLSDVRVFSKSHPTAHELALVTARCLRGFLFQREDNEAAGEVRPTDATSPMANIETLTLSNGRLGSPVPEAILQVFDFKHITTLILEQCHHPGKLLEALSSLGTLRLHTFVLDTDDFDLAKENHEPADVLDAFLASFTGLKTLKLHVQADGSPRIVKSSVIEDHKATLEVLSIDFGKRGKTIWSVAAITSITEACISLRQLSLVMAWHFLFAKEPCTATRNRKVEYHQTDFYNSLRAIARLPSLVTLNLRRLPSMSSTHCQGYLEMAYQAAYLEGQLRRFTEACMSQLFLDTRLKVLAWGRELVCSGRTGLHSCDSWSVTLCYVKEELVNSRGVRQAVAMQTEKEKLKYSEPEVDVLGVAFQQVI